MRHFKIQIVLLQQNWKKSPLSMRIKLDTKKIIWTQPFNTKCVYICTRLAVFGINLNKNKKTLWSQ